MKKINLLLTIPALVAPATLVLSQCSKDSTEGIFLDTQVSEKATMEVKKDSEENQICVIKLNESLVKTNKFTSLKVTFNGTDLDESEYEVDLEEASEGTVSVKILKATLDSKKGKYVVCPTIVEKEFTGIIAELQRITYFVGDTVKTSNITIYKSLEGTQTDVISWNEDIKVYDVVGTTETELTNFKTQGITLTSLDQKTLKIVYNTFYTFVQINVSKKQHTITCSIDANECGTLSSTSFVVQDGDVWGPLAKPTFQPKEDVDTFTLTWDWYDTNDTLIPGTKVVDSPFTAKMKVDWANTITESVSKTVDTAYDKWGVSAYIPAENVEGTGETRVLIPKEYSTDILYTITMNVTNQNIRYFWIKNCDEYRAADLLYLYKRNVVSLKVDSTEITNFTINDYYRNGVKDGSYIELPSTVTSGTIEIQIRMLKDISGIPAFQDVLA